MKIALAATVAALMAIVVVLTSASREQDLRGDSTAGPAPTSSGSSLGPAPSAFPAPLPDHQSPQPPGGTPLPRSEPVSQDAPKAAAPPAANMLLPSGDQLAALQQLVTQSRQETSGSRTSTTSWLRRGKRQTKSRGARPRRTPRSMPRPCRR